MTPIRVRFAPSPTGRLHIGGLRSALYNYLFAKKQQGTFVLRIEDTDQKRTVPGAVEDIVDGLHAYGLIPDEGFVRESGALVERGSYGPYVQSKRLHLYRSAAETLVEQGGAYPCFCTPERLAALRAQQEAQHLPPGYDGACRSLTPAEAKQRQQAGESHVIRFRVPTDGATTSRDLVRGDVTFRHATLEDAVLLKSDGFPTYHLANVVDDHAMAISHVIRAEEWLPSLPLHLLLYQAFGWQAPAYAHLPHVLGPTRKKLSKRDGHTAATDYLEAYLPSAVLNFIALLGWNPKTEREFYHTLPELVEDFDIAKVNTSGAIFDVKKLEHLHRLHLRATAPERIAQAAHLPLREDEARRYIPLVIDRAVKLTDLEPALSYLTGNCPMYDASLLIPKQGSAEHTNVRLRAVLEWLNSLSDAYWESSSSMREQCIAWIAEQRWTNQEVLWPFRVALTGSRTSPDVFDSAVALGKERTLQRLQEAIAKF